MSKMKIFSFYSLLVFCYVSGYAQFEMPKKTLKIAPVTSKNSTEVAPTSSKSITYPSIFDKKDKLLENFSFSKIKEENQKTMEGQKFESAAKEYTEKMNRKSNDGEILAKYKSDTYLGEFRVGTKIISIACRDHEAPDGDVVRIWLNDRVAVDAVLLDVEYKEIFLDLSEGINKIEIEALNQGESGPNTAQFTIYDEKKGMVTTNKWNLTTGVKAKLIVLKDNGTLQKQ